MTFEIVKASRKRGFLVSERLHLSRASDILTTPLFKFQTDTLLTPDVQVHIARVSEAAHDIPLPKYATDHSAGMDICAAVENEFVLKAGETALVPSGFAIALPEGFEAQVRSRSGLAIKHQVTVLNAPGTIDADYRGEVKVILTNFGKQDFVIARGERIAQLVIARYSRVEWQEKNSLDETARGSGGFGHTGR